MIHLRVASPADVTGVLMPMLHSEPAVMNLTMLPAASDTGVSLAFGNRSEAWGSVLPLLLNVTVLTAVAIAGLPIQRVIWRRAARRAAAVPPGLQKTGG